MPYTELATSYNTTGDVITIIIAIAFLIMIRETLFTSINFNFRIFKVAIMIIGLAAADNILFWYLSTLPIEHYIIIHICRATYNVLLICTMYLFFLYVRNLLVMSEKIKKALTYVICTWVVVASALCFITPITHFGIYRNPDGLWVRSEYTNPFALTYMVLMITMLLLLIANRANIVRQFNSILIFSIVLCSVVVAIDNIKLGNSYLAFSFIAPMMVCLVMVHSQPFDVRMGSLGREAFISYVNESYRNKKEQDYYILKLDVSSTEEVPTEIQKSIYRFNADNLKKGMIFDVRPGLYVVTEAHHAKNERVSDNIRRWFDCELPALCDRYKLGHKAIIYSKVNFIDDVSEFVRYVERTSRELNNGEIIYADDKVIEGMKSARKIIEQLWEIDEEQNLDDDRVLVYCQPVKNVTTGKFDTAEALMRMKLPELGFVFPDKFIPIAEDVGVIHTLSMIILNKTCIAVKRLLDEGYEFSRISVNFSTSEFKDPKFCDDVINIIKANNIPFEKIALELTESTDADDFASLTKAIGELRNKGMRLYLDDFGTGYSNYDRILKLNLDIVKFDRSLLLLANKDDRIKQMIGHFAAAFKGLGYGVLFEGVETDADEELCRDCGTQYLQGYKYSKPIPIEQLRDFFDK